MAQNLATYFQTPVLFKSAIQRYANDYVDKPSRDWALTGPFGKFTAYTLSEQLFDKGVDNGVQLRAMSDILQIVQSWNGDKEKEIQKYGKPSDIMNLLHGPGKEFRHGNLTMVDLTEQHYPKLVAYLDTLRIVKSNTSGYAWIPISKFLHITNPGLFPICDKKHVWDGLMSKSGGVFRNEYIDFCNNQSSRGLNLLVDMKPGDPTCKFNVNYTYWARKHMTQASPELMPYFGQWVRQYVGDMPDPYNLKNHTNTFYALAFEVVALGAGSLEGAPR